jgi:GTP-binding protein YchF
MKIGIIGLPSSGKSTLFGLLTEDLEKPDYSQGTKPRLRSVKHRDERLERLRDDYSPKKYTPATLEFLDFPGVASDQHDRSGLADILAPAREADALIITLCGFRGEGGEARHPVLDEWNEAHGELVLADLSVAERRLEKLVAKSRRPNYTDDDRREHDILIDLVKRLEAEEDVSEAALGPEDVKRINGFGFLTAKPRVTVVSWDGGTGARGAPAELLEALSAVAGGEVLSVSSRNELEILELPPEERIVFLEEYGIEAPQKESVIDAAYRVAGCISFFTAGEKEVRAWTIRQGDTAPQAAGAIHTDFERGFIRAEVVSFEDYVACGSVKSSKEKGLYRLEGREYVMHDGDVVEFRFSV